MRLSRVTLIFALYIIISSLYMQQAWKALRAIFGEAAVTLSLISLFIAAVFAVVYRSIKAGIALRKRLLICAVCVLAFIFAWRQPYFSERAHVLEFALLGWLAAKDLIKKDKSALKAVIFAFIFAGLTGILEEAFQKLLPWRVCEIRDMLTDTISGLFGIVLFILS